jgi:hypothetical protein
MGRCSLEAVTRVDERMPRARTIRPEARRHAQAAWMDAGLLRNGAAMESDGNRFWFSVET